MSHHKNSAPAVDQVKATLDLVVDRFSRGEVAAAIAKATFPSPSTPCVAWSLRR